MSDKRKYLNNKNGNFSIEEFVRLIHNGKIDDYMRRFKSSEHKCPPKELITSESMCFYCVQCMRDCISQVKENKDSYTVKKVKYMKADLNNE